MVQNSPIKFNSKSRGYNHTLKWTDDYANAFLSIKYFIAALQCNIVMRQWNALLLHLCHASSACKSSWTRICRSLGVLSSASKDYSLVSSPLPAPINVPLNRTMTEYTWWNILVKRNDTFMTSDVTDLLMSAQMMLLTNSWWNWSLHSSFYTTHVGKILISHKYAKKSQICSIKFRFSKQIVYEK